MVDTDKQSMQENANKQKKTQSAKTQAPSGLKRTFIQLIQFGFVGVAATIIDFGVLIFLVQIFHLDPVISAAISFIISLIFNYVVSMRYVFRHRQDISRKTEFIIFAVLSIIGLGLNELLMWLCINVVGIFYVWAKVIATALVMIWNFVSRKIWLDAPDAGMELPHDKAEALARDIEHPFRQKNVVRVLGICVLVLFIAALIPILVSAFFAHPYGDDYGFGLQVHNAVASGGNIFDILAAAFQTVAHWYQTLQGTFSAIFLFALQPGVFGDSLYFITTFILVGGLTLGVYFLVHTVLTRYLGMSHWYSVIVALGATFMMIEFIPSKVQGLYWFNGASYYTLFWAIEAIFFALMIRFALLSCAYAESAAPNKRTAKRNSESQKTRTRTRIKLWASFIVLLLLAVILGGTNYTTSLFTMCILAFAVLFVLVRKKPLRLCYIALLAVGLVAFFINVSAPGNAVRTQALGGSFFYTPFEAVRASLYWSMSLIARWTQIPQIAFFLFVTPVMIFASKRCTWSFRWPIIVVVMLLCLFAVQLCAPELVFGGLGDGREVNSYYYSYYIFVMAALFYVCGWVQKRAPQLLNMLHAHLLLKRFIVPGILSLAALFVAGSLFYTSATPDISYGASGIRSLTTIDTALALKRGIPQAYSEQYKAALAQLENGAGTVELTEVTSIPDFFFGLSITEDPEFWVNRNIAQYYGLDGVILASAPWVN